jgi:hypothetical protein
MRTASDYTSDEREFARQLSLLRRDTSAASKASLSASGVRWPKKARQPASRRAARPSRNRRERTRAGRKKPGLQAIQREPSGDRPPPGRMTWACG